MTALFAPNDLQGGSSTPLTASPPVAPTATERLAGERLCVLLVDDDPDDILLTSDSLRAAFPCVIESATSGAEALQKIEAAGESYHAVLLDHGLPDMSGLDVLTEIRAQSAMLPVILVTGFGGETTVMDALRRGANDYVVKTGDYLRVLPEIVAQVIERERLRRRAEHLEMEHLRFARLAAVGEVAAGIAHEIRNPLTVIAGMAALIHDNYSALKTEDLERCTKAIVENCRHLNGVLEEIMQTAQASPAREPLALRTVLEETLSFMRFDMQWRHSMAVEARFETEGMIVGDRDQLKQVIINLFRNAHQAVQMAEKKRGNLKIVLREDGAAREVVAEITDNGVDIPEAILPQIFESGFSTKTSEAKVKGSGLGLSICRRIVEAHEGRLWAQSRDGATTFFLALPLAPNK